MKTFTLSKKERIKLNNDFQRVYNSGKVYYSSQGNLKVNYYFESSVNNSGIKAAFVVSKRAGKAVWRNRVKRLMREAYRLNKISLEKICNDKNILLLMSFSPNKLNQKQNKKINFNFIIDDFIELLEAMKNKIKNA